MAGRPNGLLREGRGGLAEVRHRHRRLLVDLLRPRRRSRTPGHLHRHRPWAPWPDRILLLPHPDGGRHHHRCRRRRAGHRAPPATMSTPRLLASSWAVPSSISQATPCSSGRLAARAAVTAGRDPCSRRAHPRRPGRLDARPSRRLDGHPRRCRAVGYTGRTPASTRAGCCAYAFSVTREPGPQECTFRGIRPLRRRGAGPRVPS